MRMFDVNIQGDLIWVRPLFPDLAFKVYENNRRLAANSHSREAYLTLQKPTPSTLITIEYVVNDTLQREQYPLRQYYATKDRTFEAGDILVASDNIKAELSGYMGHAAIVMNEKFLIEAPGGEPAIVKDSIQQFLVKHPLHAQFRPKQSKIAKNAADYAMNYLQDYHDNLKKGLLKPTFSFNLSQDLEDPWEEIYCSKLVWLCYHFGADYTFENDYLWFSPEDMYHQLLENDDFELIYQHQDIEFLIDT
ncbi:hypothetical protein [Gracilibacillus salinarum]|uniref:Uncharacterized protein n=1 Tax=Gracilibacillus salinarum TaxID=2932255 RepID=A0ABY4GSF1_9BACI|nr:hypothetical protein [Gracilibacillus salinarum]UOQ87328.1 hypothetical protein MUN87_10765 [Gracilibacillus salinarum]